MQYPLEVPGFEGRQLTLETAGMFAGARLLIDGAPAPKGARRGELRLRRNDGSEATAKLRVSNFLDPLPQVEIDGQRYHAAPPLRWYELIWGGLPFLLLVGGAIGALCGVIALGVNSRILRSARPGAARYLASGAVTLAALVAYLTLATIFSAGIERLFPQPAREFRSQAGGFTIQTARTLSESTQTVASEAGPIEIHLYSADAGSRSFVVSYADYPDALMRTADPPQILDGVRDGVLGNVSGSLVSEVDAELGGHPGREIVASGATEGGKEFVLRGRFFLVGSRLYQVVVVSARGEEGGAEVDQFLSSFALIGG